MGANMQDMLTINGLYTTPIAQNKWSRLICIQINSCLVVLVKINVLILWVQICQICLQLIDYILLQLHKINVVG
jgi:hypothetical protein